MWPPIGALAALNALHLCPHMWTPGLRSFQMVWRRVAAFLHPLQRQNPLQNPPPPPHTQTLHPPPHPPTPDPRPPSNLFQEALAQARGMASGGSLLLSGDIVRRTLFARSE